jgi:hypothetical protein
MKKVLLLAVVALFVMMPLASFAMTTISDSDLNAITAQEGVSIYLNNLSVTTNLNNFALSWGQATVPTTLTGGAGTFTNGGYFGAIISTPTNVAIGVNGLMTIDVGINLTTLGTSFVSSKSGYGGIAIGLNDMKVDFSGLNMSMVVRAGAEQTLQASSTNGASPSSPVATYLTLGTAYVGIGSLNTTINGQVVISTH